MHETNISAWQALMDAVGGWISQGQTHIRNKQMEGGGPPPPPRVQPPSSPLQTLPPLPLFQRRWQPESGYWKSF